MTAFEVKDACDDGNVMCAKVFRLNLWWWCAVSDVESSCIDLLILFVIVMYLKCHTCSACQHVQWCALYCVVVEVSRVCIVVVVDSLLMCLMLRCSCCMQAVVTVMMVCCSCRMQAVVTVMMLPVNHNCPMVSITLSFFIVCFVHCGIVLWHFKCILSVL